REELATVPADSEWGFHLAAILGMGELQNLGADVHRASAILDERLAAAGKRISPDIALMITAAGMLAWARSELDVARVHGQRGVRAARSAGAVEVELQARTLLTWLDVTAGRPRAEIISNLLDDVRLARATGHHSREASALLQIARLTLDE